MQFSENWLRTFVNPKLTSEELGHLLTMAGLELEELDPAAPAFNKIVVGEILTAEKHPNADKLRVTTVNVGGEILQIVCGAPNAAVGLKVPCALVGAQLPGDFNIKKAKVRDVESFGMLCSAKELGLAEESDGLLVLPADAPVGTDIREYLGLDDKLFTLKLTPNRADCLSILGIAREVAALTGCDLSAPAIKPVAVSSDKTRAVIVEATQHCPRYAGRVVTGVDAAVATPGWMVQRLARSGIRSISAIVDITNYVLLEQGQPMHAFDNAKLSGAIHVRLPHSGEQLKLLNGNVVTPSADTVLIADEARALALGGIMGGDDSGVTDATTEIFLESAFFAPEVIAGKARALNFSTDSSFRFERGVDFSRQRDALERATQLVLDICGGVAAPVTEIIADLPKRNPVKLRFARLNAVIGMSFERATVETLLKQLRFEWRADGDDFIVTPPAHRFDIEIEEDLIEEVARLYGYDNIPAVAPVNRVAMLPLPEARRMPMQVRRLVAERDYQEVVNFSFVETAWEKDFAGNDTPIALANPIASQMSVMRTTLIGGLVNTLVFNLKRRTNRVRVFELGRCFWRDATGTPVTGFAQPLRIAALVAGPVEPEQWGIKTRNVDFFDAKGDVEALFPGRDLRFEKAVHPALHPGRSAAILLDGQKIGVIGELHPEWTQKYELNSAPVVFELELSALLDVAMPAYASVSRFPVVERDLAFVVAQDAVLQDLLDVLKKAAAAQVKHLDLFDVYQGKGLDEGQKSLAFRVVMQDTDKTLEDAEVDAMIARLIDAARQFGAVLRA
ncbi:MAG TPA: phenylalanine--tRNA ligase subunit beta [Rhodocyclaceae bacterium]|nr:phenylalanine--tRNA ligase subunit beta [Rhodocyclaceae bacterium]